MVCGMFWTMCVFVVQSLNADTSDIGKIGFSQLQLRCFLQFGTIPRARSWCIKIYGSGSVGEVWCKFAGKTLLQQAEERQKSDLVVQYDWYSIVYLVQCSRSSCVLVYLVHWCSVVWFWCSARETAAALPSHPSQATDPCTAYHSAHVYDEDKDKDKDKDKNVLATPNEVNLLQIGHL